MLQLSPVKVLSSLGYHIDSLVLQPTNADDSSALEAANLSSALKEIERLREEIRLVRLQLARPVSLNDQDSMDV
jgi:hypothetical protein